MKKSYLGLATMAALVLASCSNEEALQPNTGVPGTSTFNVSIAQSLGSRAISDGEAATELHYQVYTSTGEKVDGKGGTETITSTVKVEGLTPNETYKIVFWAQNPSCEQYDTQDLTAVKITYLDNNDESMDAFCAVTEFSANGTSNDVTLKRPFAQINVGVPAYPEGVSEQSTSEVKISGTICTTYNVLTKTATDEVSTEQTFRAKTVPNEELTVNGTTYKYLSMTYVLVNDEAALTKYTLKVDDKENFVSEDNLPVNSNYRTNILGLAPGSAQFEVVIDPKYGDNNNVGMETVTVSEVKAVYNAGNVELSAKYSANEKLEVANFVLTPSLITKADGAEVIIVPAEEIYDDEIKATYNGALVAGYSYKVTVEVPGMNVEVEDADEESTDNVFEVPEVSESDVPEAYLYGFAEGSGWGITETNKFSYKGVEGGYNVYTIECEFKGSESSEKVFHIGGKNPNGETGDYYLGDISFYAQNEDGSTILTETVINKELTAKYQKGGGTNSAVRFEFKGTLTLKVPTDHSVDAPKDGIIIFNGEGSSSGDNQGGETTDPDPTPQPGPDDESGIETENGIIVAYLMGEGGIGWGPNPDYKFTGREEGEQWIYTLKCSLSSVASYKIGASKDGGQYFEGQIAYSPKNETGHDITTEDFGKDLEATYAGGNFVMKNDFSGTITLKVPKGGGDNGTIIFTPDAE